MESLLLQVADEKELNPFELVLIISRQKTQVLARIFDQNKTLQAQLDAGKIIQDLFFSQLALFPEQAKDFVIKDLGGDKLQTFLLDALKEKSFLIHYGTNDKLQTVEITKTSKKIVNIDELLKQFKF